MKLELHIVRVSKSLSSDIPQGLKTVSALGLPAITAWLEDSGISGSDLIVAIPALSLIPI